MGYQDEFEHIQQEKEQLGRIHEELIQRVQKNLTAEIEEKTLPRVLAELLVDPLALAERVRR